MNTVAFNYDLVNRRLTVSGKGTVDIPMSHTKAQRLVEVVRGDGAKVGEFYGDVLQPTVCPHGCRKPGDCLRYDQGGSVPADCLLEQQYDDDYREAWERAWGWKP